MKGRRITIPIELHEQALDKLNINQIAIGKTRLLARESKYWINVNADIDKTVKLLNIS